MANMLANAAKYTDPGGTIAASARADGEVAAAPSRDNGIGIRAHVHAARVRHLRAGCALDRLRAGRPGPGPGDCEEHRQSSRGNCHSRQRWSRPGQRIPRAPASSGGGRATGGEAAGGAGAGPRRILIVDDNEDAADSWISGSAHWGMSLARRATAAARWRPWPRSSRMWHCWTFGLPGMDGYELARRIRATAEEKPPI